MYVGKIKWYESFWSILICILLSPLTGFLSLFPAIIFLFFRLKKEIKRIAINKKNNLPLNHKLPYEEPKKKENNPMIKQHLQPVRLSEQKLTEEQLNETIDAFVQDNFKVTFNGPTQSRNVVTNKKYDYTKVRKLVKDFTVLDFETTGLDPLDDNIIQIGAVRYRDFEIVDTYYTYINPFIEISSTITRITGITDEDVESAPSIYVELPRLIEFIGKDTIVAHNASFDMKFLLENIEEIGLNVVRFRVIDTLPLSRKQILKTKNHKLPTLKKFLELSHLDSHDALADCKVTGELYKYCYEKSLLVK